MKIKTSDLIDAALDFAVALARDESVRVERGRVRFALSQFTNDYDLYSPSTDWSQGGPIIEREEICTKRQAPASVGYEWNAWIWTKHTAKGGSNAGGSGPTPLVAAMRCYVASKLGDEIDIPKELT